MTLSILLVVGSLALFILEVFFVSLGALAVAAVAMGIGGLMAAFGVSQTFGWIMAGVLFVGIPLSLRLAFGLLRKLHFARGFYLRRVRIDEQGHFFDAGVEEAGDDPVQPVAVARHVETE